MTEYRTKKSRYYTDVPGVVAALFVLIKGCSDSVSGFL